MTMFYQPHAIRYSDFVRHYWGSPVSPSPDRLPGRRWLGAFLFQFPARGGVFYATVTASVLRPKKADPKAGNHERKQPAYC